MGYCEHCDHCNVETLDGASLRERRQRIPATLRTMATRLGISAAYLSDIELGRRRVKMIGVGGRILKLLEGNGV